MLGLGDNIYQRAFIKQLPKPLTLTTPWPELYQDLDIQFANPQTRLRTQAKNAQNTKHKFVNASGGIQIHYGKEGIFQGMRQRFQIEPAKLDLPDFGPSPVDGDYIVVRPVTLRIEWLAQSRNPLAQYVNEATAWLKEKGYKVVSVADLEKGLEWADGPLPDADIAYHQGELNICQLMALIQNAKAVIGGVGWIVPAAIAANIPAWIVLGGNGGHNCPAAITDTSQDLSKLGWATPDRFCQCFDRKHQCNKVISNHRQQFDAWLSQLKDEL